MVKGILLITLGAILGHFGPITVAKWTMNTSANASHTVGKVLDTANRMVK